MNGHHSLGLGRDLTLEIIGVDGPGILIDVCPDDMCAKIAEGNGRRTVSIRGHDDLVAGWMWQKIAASFSALVQLFTPKAYFAPTNAAKSFSNFSRYLPCVWPSALRITSTTAWISASVYGCCIMGKITLNPSALPRPGRIGQLCLWHIHTLLNRFVLRRAARGAYFSVWTGIPSCRGSGHGAAPQRGAAAAGSAE